MSRILPFVTAVLLVLVVLGRLGRERSAAPPAPTVASPVAPEPGSQPAISAGQRRTPGEPRADPAAQPATPELDRLVVLATRQRLAREQRYTYIDSLLASTDSVVRRWADREGRPLHVALVDAPELPGWRPILPTIARRALAAWQDVYPELRFEVVGDSEAAEITIRWIEKFEIDRTGQTDLQFLSTGILQRAEIQLALQTNDSRVLSDVGLAAVAVHEVGHALGLPHSGSGRDVMFPDTRSGTISSRDRATLVLLYALAPGSLRLDLGAR